MFMCFLSCLCLDLYLCVLHAMFMCLDLHVRCYAMCFYSHFCLMIYLFLVLWTLRYGVNLDLAVYTYIHTPRPISTGLDHLLYAYVCLFASRFISMFACLDLGFAMLGTLCGLMLLGLCGHLLVWLHLSFLWFGWM